MSPAAAASTAVAARAAGPSRFTRSVRVSGPRLLLSTTLWPAPTARSASVLPMFPLPMSPMVVTYAATSALTDAFPSTNGPRAPAETRSGLRSRSPSRRPAQGVTALWAMVVAAPRQLVGHPAQVRGIHGVVLGTPDGIIRSPPETRSARPVLSR